jgi:hypothetical protein
MESRGTDRDLMANMPDIIIEPKKKIKENNMHIDRCV